MYQQARDRQDLSLAERKELALVMTLKVGLETMCYSTQPLS